MVAQSEKEASSITYWGYNMAAYEFEKGRFKNKYEFEKETNHACHDLFLQKVQPKTCQIISNSETKARETVKDVRTSQNKTCEPVQLVETVKNGSCGKWAEPNKVHGGCGATRSQVPSA